MYEKAAAAWKSTKQPHPRCEKHGKLAKMHVVKNLLKSNYGRPFFVWSDQTNPKFWLEYLDSVFFQGPNWRLPKHQQRQGGGRGRARPFWFPISVPRLGLGLDDRYGT